MFGLSFKRRAHKPVKEPPAVPEHTVVWAVGDIHGRLDLLRPLVEAMLIDLGQSEAKRKVMVFLGDYIDRGPDSRGVLDLLHRLRLQGGVEAHFIRGNHEDRMEAFLTEPDLGPGWCDYGGREALRSYGLTPPPKKGDEAGWAAVSTELNALLSDDQRALLSAQESSVSIGDYFFAHAGALPGVPLDLQDPQDLMWIRQPFLDHPAAFDRIVVHGHTPTEEVHADHRRIGLDTGAYATGVLTGLRLEGTAREVLQTSTMGGVVTLTRREL